MALGTTQAKNPYFEAMLREGTNTGPIQSPWQGASRMMHALLAGLEMRDEDRQSKEYTEALKNILPALVGGTTPTTPQPSMAPPSSPIMPSASNRVYAENEMNPLDAKVATPQELSVGVPSFVPQQYRALTGKAAIDSDIPVDVLAKQTRQESGFKPNAVSPAGALGISQFMPATAREVGINPLNPQQAIPAQAAYLRQQIDRFGGSLPQGLAAYNYGPGNVSKVGGDINRMPAETRNYVASILGGQQPNQQIQQPNAAQLQPQQQVAQAPNMNAQIDAMLSSPNKKIRDLGASLRMNQVQQALKPADYDFQKRDDGSIVAINKRNPQDIRVLKPGDSQDLIDFEAKKAGAVKASTLQAERAVTAPERKAQQLQVGRLVTQDIDRAIKEIDNATLPTTGTFGPLISQIGGTAASNVRSLLDTVRANVGFEELNKMRQASPTGGALGQITERELALLQATVGNMEQSQTKQQLQDNLRRVKNTYLDIIHGPGNGPAREKLTFQEPTQEATQTKTINGKTYFKKNNQWFEQ